jgi:hypothetical protein
MNNSEESWAFLKQFSLLRTTPVAKQLDFIGREMISVSYRAGFIRFYGIHKPFNVKVFDTRNKFIKSATVIDNTLDFNNRANGIYLIVADTDKGPKAVKAFVP